MPRVCLVVRRRAARQSAPARHRNTRGRLTEDTGPTSFPQAYDGSRTRLQDSVVVDDPPTDDRQQRPLAHQILARDGEAVSVQDDHVAMMADFNRADVVLPDEPLVGRRGEPE